MYDLNLFALLFCQLLKQECFNTQLQLAKKGYLEQNIVVAQNEMKVMGFHVEYFHHFL